MYICNKNHCDSYVWLKGEAALVVRRRGEWGRGVRIKLRANRLERTQNKMQHFILQPQQCGYHRGVGKRGRAVYMPGVGTRGGGGWLGAYSNDNTGSGNGAKWRCKKNAGSTYGARRRRRVEGGAKGGWQFVLAARLKVCKKVAKFKK